MNFVRLDAPSEKVLFSINDVIKNVTDVIGDSRVHLDLDSSDPTVRGTLVEFRNVVVELLLNACEHARARDQAGIIMVETRVEGNSCGIRVSDDGPGIPEKLKPYIFDGFVTASPTRTGLGLNYVKAVVEKCNEPLCLPPKKAELVMIISPASNVRMRIRRAAPHPPSADRFRW